MNQFYHNMTKGVAGGGSNWKLTYEDRKTTNVDDDDDEEWEQIVIPDIEDHSCKSKG